MNREELQYLKYIDFKNKLEKLNIQLKNKKVVLYGAGILLETAIEKYDFTKLNIIAISDKKFEREPVESFAGIKTINSEKISELNPDVILLSVKNYKNLFKNPKKCIIIKRTIILYTLFCGISSKKRILCK